MAVAARLVSQSGDVGKAAKRLVAAAEGHGIDLTLVWGIFEAGESGVVARQCCLLVPGPGRTVMAFVSEPAQQSGPGWEATGAADRASCVEAAVREFPRLRPGAAAVAQALPSPVEDWAVVPLLASGFLSVGELDYMRLEAATTVERPSASMDAGWALRSLHDVPQRERREILLKVLEASYEQTMDCPELCGVRSTEDILDSHFATGQFDARLWWLVTATTPDGVRNVGCVLMSACPEQRLVELVYLGLEAGVRGRRWSRDILAVAVQRVRERYRSWPITCAVDGRNEPAGRLYRGLGFSAFGRRLALVRGL